MAIKYLVAPWVVRGERVLSENSHFAYLQPAKVLAYMVLVFIGVIKPTSGKFPMAYLKRRGFDYRLNCYVLVSEEVN